MEKLIRKIESHKIDIPVYRSALVKLSNIENVFNRYVAGPMFVELLYNKGLLNEKNAQTLRKSIPSSRAEYKKPVADQILSVVMKPSEIPEGF